MRLNSANLGLPPHMIGGLHLTTEEFTVLAPATSEGISQKIAEKYRPAVKPARQWVNMPLASSRILVGSMRTYFAEFKSDAKLNDPATNLAAMIVAAEVPAAVQRSADAFNQASKTAIHPAVGTLEALDRVMHNPRLLTDPLYKLEK